MNDPIHFVRQGDPDEYNNPTMKEGWYFWDETWADKIGPFLTEEIARKELDNYCKILNRAKVE